jgi:hypothetical protein
VTWQPDHSCPRTECGTDALARDRRVRMPVQLAHERPAIVVTELGGDNVIG